MSQFNQRVEGYVLHRRGFTDNKKLIHLFSAQHGRLTAVFRESKRRPSPMPFICYSFELSGSHELKNLKSAESTSPLKLSHGKPLFCGMYLNELVMRLLPEHQPCTEMAAVYAATLEGLSASSALSAEQMTHIQQVLLRRFEFSLLRELGLAVNFSHCANAHDIPADSSAYYKYEPSLGFSKVHLTVSRSANVDTTLYTGDMIHAIANEDWSQSSLAAAKSLSRAALKPLLGGKPIKARELFS